MIKNLKNLVIFLGIIVLLLFSITIVSLIYKFKNKDLKNIENVELFPSLENGTVINSFEIKGNLLSILSKTYCSSLNCKNLIAQQLKDNRMHTTIFAQKFIALFLSLSFFILAREV